MVDALQSLLIVLFEIICCRIFFDSFFKNDADSRKKGFQFFLLYLCDTLTAIIFSNNLWIRQFIVIIVHTLLLCWIYKGSLKKVFILTIIYQGIVLTVDSLVLAITSRFFVDENLPESDYIVPAMMVVAFGKIVLFLCVLIIQRIFWKKNIGVIRGEDWAKLLCFPVFTILIILLLCRYFTHLENQRQADVLFVVAFGLIGLNIMMLFLINGITKREMQISEDRMLKLQMENQIALYNSMSDNLENQRMQAHEFKNRILCISSLLEQNNLQELREYVGRINNELNCKNIMVYNTNHAIVNAILNAKYQEMLQKNIMFVLKANNLAGLNMEEDDLVIVLSNLLNNAIEACEACENGNRIIKMKFLQEREEIIISIKNTYRNAVQKENNHFITSKTTETTEHGIGIKNIQRIVEKYGGSHQIHYENGEFTFSIIISL